MTINFSQKELCEYLGWDYRQVAEAAKAEGVATHVYIQQRTDWVLISERYYLPSTYASDVEVDRLGDN